MLYQIINYTNDTNHVLVMTSKPLQDYFVILGKIDVCDSSMRVEIFCCLDYLPLILTSFDSVHYHNTKEKTSSVLPYIYK